MRQAGRPADQVARLVDEHGVRRGPAGRAGPAGRRRPHDRGLLAGGQHPVGRRLQGLRRRQQAEHQPDRVNFRPDRVHRGPHRPGPPHRLVGTVVTGLPGALHHGQDHVRDPVLEQFAGRAVADAAVPQLVHELLDLPGGHPPAPRAARQHHRGRRRADRGPQRPPQHLRHPRVALDDRGRLVVRAADLDRGDQLADGGLGDVDLAERGQHVADVREEGLVRPDHDHAAPPDLLAVRVQQVRDPVQPDRGLPGAGRALHADGLRRVGAHDIVLVGLDGRDDVPHGSRPRPLDLVDQDPARPGGRDRGRTGRAAALGPTEELVLVGGQLAACEPEAPPPRQVHRVGRAGPVERS